MNIRLENSDFHWWRTADEKTEFSRSTVGFNHMIAQSYSDKLTTIQVRKLNLIVRNGFPLDRWMNGILLLLQKEIGNIDIDKLRFIILFEADFNFLLKKIFAQRLMARAIENDTLPIEFYSMKGKSAKEAIITRTLWCDINRLEHRSFAVVSADLSQCFDMIGHSQCSLAMQAQGCPIKPISIMLFTLQNMNYWIRSAYGETPRHRSVLRAMILTWGWDREAEDPTLDVPSHSPLLSMHIKEKDITQP